MKKSAGVVVTSADFFCLRHYPSHTFTAKPPLKKYVFVQCPFGGDGGNRTPVRKHFNRNFSGRRRSFTFPRPAAGRHAAGLGSFIIHGPLKALRAHVHHLSTPHPGPWSSRVERSLIMQREEQNYRCSLIYKSLPVLWMSGASARYFCLRTPVETSTPPYIKVSCIFPRGAVQDPARRAYWLVNVYAGC